VASGDHPLLRPVVSLVYATLIAAVVLAIDQIFQFMPGAWFNLLAACVIALSVTTVVLLSRAAWRRYREGLDRRAAGWLVAALAAALLGGVAGVELVESAQLAAQISGADVRVTKPLIESLPRPTDATVLNEQPGLADTESISEEIKAKNLNAVIPFYRVELGKRGWVEDTTSASASTVRFVKGSFIVSIDLDPGSSSYALIVDRINANLLGSPSASPAPSP
jgi:hypothetical protein